QELPAMLVQRFRGDTAVPGYDESASDLAIERVWRTYDRRHFDSRMHLDNLLDLGRIDVVAARFVHVGVPSDDGDRPVGGSHGHIACPEPAIAGKGRPGGRVILPVALHEEGAAH